MIKNCLILEYISLPKEIQEKIKCQFDYKFANDIMIEFNGECFDNYGEDTTPEENLREWYQNEIIEGSWDINEHGEFEDWIEENHFHIDWWIIEYMKEYDYNPKMIDKVIIDICW